MKQKLLQSFSCILILDPLLCLPPCSAWQAGLAKGEAGTQLEDRGHSRHREWWRKGPEVGRTEL